MIDARQNRISSCVSFEDFKIFLVTEGTEIYRTSRVSILFDSALQFIRESKKTRAFLWTYFTKIGKGSRKGSIYKASHGLTDLGENCWSDQKNASSHSLIRNEFVRGKAHMTSSRVNLGFIRNFRSRNSKHLEILAEIVGRITTFDYTVLKDQF